MAKRAKTRAYVAPVRYTASELRAAAIADLETDIRCAERDGLIEYADECRAQLSKLKEEVCDGHGNRS